MFQQITIALGLTSIIIGGGKSLPPANAPWPREMDFPANMVPYQRATKVQQLADTSFNGSAFISSIAINDRYELDDKRWHQSGGMLGIPKSEYRSDLYRYFPTDPEVWIGDVQVKNSFGYFQTVQGWRVNYADGTKLMDVLSHKGKVFEIRQRTKQDGKWQSILAYENIENRPPQYTGLTVSCNSCHKEPGTGGYAKGLVPGGDGVFSIGLKPLEDGRYGPSTQPLLRNGSYIPARN